MISESFFEAHGLSCRIEADSELLSVIEKDQFTYHYMIGAKRVLSTSSDVQIIQNDSLSVPVVLQYPRAFFRKTLSPRDVVVVSEYLLERARQEKKGLYNVSSACASLDNLAVTFYGGATNLGKTSSMLTLVNRCGFDFVSDEKTLLHLDNRTVVGGSISVPTRKKVIREKFFSDTSQDLPEYKDLSLAQGEKIAGLMVYPHLDNGLKQPLFYKWKPLDFFWLLTRDLSHEIRGGIRLVNNFSYLLPSLDTDELTLKRVEATKSFCNHVACYYFQGSWDQVAEYIPRFLKEENAR